MELAQLIARIAALLTGVDSAKWYGILTQVLDDTFHVANNILEYIKSVALPAIDVFRAEDFFKEDTSDQATVKISYLGPNFKAKFLKKVETGIVATVIKAYKLLVSSLDPEIMTAIGKDRVISLAHLAELLKAQDHGQEGFLLVNGWSNIFYIEDVDGVTCAVHARWLGDGWSVEAYSVGHPDGWLGGLRVFSR